MPLAGGAHAENEASRSVGDPGPIGVPDHGRVKEGRRFEGILRSEVSADQYLAPFADWQIGEQMLADLVEDVRGGARRLLGTAGRIQEEIGKLDREIDSKIGKAR